ncbi:ABC transporter ATP-binding protein [Aquabacter cavernae]|uniref:ABC transporter ATP-binding protein n=1 Tax=Aquabacter cavernae TaxID=2496029 RepID=UPI000F8E6A8A|nr:ABC transporter ATP-binding protein [Aquabacter cavernae]
MSASRLLDISGVTVAYGQVTALQGVSLSVDSGEVVALVGSNGAGKTTLMKSIVGLLPVSGGDLHLKGLSLARVSTHQRARRGIGYSPEGRRVFPGLSVRENLEVASFDAARGTAEMIGRVYAIFPALQEKEKALGWTLSGGQQQMLAIGRALMLRPKLLLLDEPSLGLSPKLTDEVLQHIPKLVADGTGVLIAEQNMLKALEIADRAYVLRNGRIVQEGAAAALKADPSVRDAFLGGR